MLIVFVPRMIGFIGLTAHHTDKYHERAQDEHDVAQASGIEQVHTPVTHVS